MLTTFWSAYTQSMSHNLQDPTATTFTMPVTQSQQHSASSTDPTDTTMEESAAAEPTETLEENSMDAITHFRCNIMGEQQENGRLLDAFESLQIQSMLDFILLEQENLESSTTIDDGKLTRIEIRKLLKAKDWFITQPGTKPCLLVNCSPIF